jgi:hypothetical protein
MFLMMRNDNLVGLSVIYFFQSSHSVHSSRLFGLLSETFCWKQLTRVHISPIFFIYFFFFIINSFIFDSIYVLFSCIVVIRITSMLGNFVSSCIFFWDMILFEIDKFERTMRAGKSTFRNFFSCVFFKSAFLDLW